MGFYAYKLDEATREGLLATIAPSYSHVEADHILYKTGDVGESMPELHKAEILGAIDDGKGLQVAIVRINGEIERPDGKFYHIVWSRDPNCTHDIDHDMLAHHVQTHKIA